MRVNRFAQAASGDSRPDAASAGSFVAVPQQLVPVPAQFVVVPAQFVAVPIANLPMQFVMPTQLPAGAAAPQAGMWQEIYRAAREQAEAQLNARWYERRFFSVWN